MNKREFLKTGGLLGIASVLPTGRLSASGLGGDRGACVLIPSETAGPFPLDLSANTFYFRQDIREAETGAVLRQRLRIIGVDNCEPIGNLRVNVWHCDNMGVYSGYPNQNGGENTTGQTFLRGYQFTDANGECEFITVFPGWYPGRVCHIHFQVYVSPSYAAISQLTYPVPEKQAVYAANPSLYPNGADPVAIESDGIFGMNYQYQLATLTYNSDTGEYESFLEVAIQGSGTPVSLQEIRNREQFEVGQNQPNPYSGSTTVPVTLHTSGDLRIDLYDLQGKRVGGVVLEGLAAGEHLIPLDIAGMRLPHANYAYQVDFRNESGVFRTCKLMTALR